MSASSGAPAPARDASPISTPQAHGVARRPARRRPERLASASTISGLLSSETIRARRRPRCNGGSPPPSPRPRSGARCRGQSENVRNARSSAGSPRKPAERPPPTVARASAAIRSLSGPSPTIASRAGVLHGGEGGTAAAILHHRSPRPSRSPPRRPPPKPGIAPAPAACKAATGTTFGMPKLLPQ